MKSRAAMLTALAALVALPALGLLMFWSSEAPRSTSSASEGQPARVSYLQEPKRLASESPAPPVATSPAEAFLIDEVGEPVGGARIALLDPDNQIVEETHSDQQGGFHFSSPAEPGTSRRVRIEGAGLIASTALVRAELATQIMVQREALVSAIVRDAEGVPSAGAQVYLLSGVQGARIVGRTEADGRVRFEGLAPGGYQLYSSSGTQVSALATVRADAGDGLEEVALQLAPGTRLRGRITAGGLGVLAALQLVPEDHDHAVFEVQSNLRGEFEVSALPRGRWQVQAISTDYAQLDPLGLRAQGPEAHMLVPLVETSAIAGRVLDESGRAVEGAALQLVAVGPRRVEHRAPVPSALRWVHPLAGKRFMPIRDTRRFGAKRSGLRPLECGGGHCGVDLGGERGWPVMAAADGRIVVASSDDRGKSGRYVAIEHADGLKTFYMHLDSVSESLALGQSVRAGTLLGRLGRSGIQHSEPHLHFSLSRTVAEQPIFIDPEPMLRFAVVLPEPAGLVGSEVVLADAIVGPELGPRVEEGTAWNGGFERERVRPGTYRLLASHPGLAPGKSEVFSLKPGQRLEQLEIVLPAGRRLEGRILGPRGALPDAWVRAYQGEGESRQLMARASADAEGFFQLRPLEGPVELEFGAAGHGVVSKQLRADPGELLVELPAFDAQLTGQVEDASGMPVIGAQVEILSGPAARGRRVPTDAYGFFRFENVPAGSYELRVRSVRFPERNFKIKNNSDAQLELELGGAVHIEVRDHHTKEALAGQRVLAEGPGGLSSTALTDALGRVEFAALRPGDWRFRLESSEYMRFSSSLRVLARERGAQKLVAELARGASLAGVLHDAEGERVVGAKVWVGHTVGRTDSEGHFRLDQVPTGEVRLRAEAEGQQASYPITLFAGDEYVTIELNLEELADTDE